MDTNKTVKHDDDRFEKILTEERIEEFNKNGHLIIDNFLGEQWSKELLAECKQMGEQNLITQHKFQFGNQLFEKPNIFEIDLHDQNKRKHSKELEYIFSNMGPSFVEAAQKKFKNLDLDFCPSAIKLQYNKGEGGCFPWHYDNAGPPSKRKLTCVIYLNPDWKEGDGGEVVLCPFLKKQVIVPPKMDRAVLFLSDQILHRVLPSKKERFCFTVWCDGLSVNSPDETLLTKDKLQFTSYDQAEEFFRSTPLQRVLSRAVYNQEYEESLKQCVGGTQFEAPMLRQHEASYVPIEKQLKPLINEFRNRKNKIQEDAAEQNQHE